MLVVVVMMMMMMMMTMTMMMMMMMMMLLLLLLLIMTMELSLSPPVSQQIILGLPARRELLARKVKQLDPHSTKRIDFDSFWDWWSERNHRND
jgi:hypothetical protein